jgi:molybdopterin/thiamine biosynthesis adenylyltransferase
VTLETYDDAAYDRFCADLVNAGFSPGILEDGSPCWTGPLRTSLKPLTQATRMRLELYTGWPLRYAHVVVEGLHTEHHNHGTICLWAEDDPAQIDGQTLPALWERLDQWAAAAQSGFGPADRALDANFLFTDQSTWQAELPLHELLNRASDGSAIEVFGSISGETLLITHGNPPDPRTRDKPLLHGAFYLRTNIGAAPRTFGDVQDALSRHQRRNLSRGVERRSDVVFPKVSGGHDFIVLAWPRHVDDHDAVVLEFSGTDETISAAALPATSNDAHALRLRAGPDAEALAAKTVLIAGVGSVGGHVAVALACAGVGTIRLHDSDRLSSANLVRHVCTRHFVGHRKTFGVGVVIQQHAPWTAVSHHDDLPYGPTPLRAAIENYDLVVDCTGVLPLSAALADTCLRHDVALITGALYHQGALARVRRQAAGDTPIATRSTDDRYHTLPPEDAAQTTGFLELGCTAPVNNASPIAVLATAADVAAAAVDLLTERRERPDERITVYRPMDSPLHRTGSLDPFIELDGTTP